MTDKELIADLVEALEALMGEVLHKDAGNPHGLPMMMDNARAHLAAAIRAHTGETT